MISRNIELLNTNGEKIYTRSAVNCSSKGRYDLTAVVGRDDNYYIVNNYSYIDGVPYFKGDYVKINKDLFYCMAYSYSLESKTELFGPNVIVYDDMVSEIVEILKPCPERLERQKNNNSNLSIDTIRNEIQARIYGEDPSICINYLKASLKKLCLEEEVILNYNKLLGSINVNNPVEIQELAKKLNFEIH